MARRQSEEITSAQTYWLGLEKNPEKAYAVALDHRKVEADLYWKRAAYFWAILAAAFGGYFLIEGRGDPIAQLTLGCLGFLFSLAWYLVNRSSAYWHATWDHHVMMFEDGQVGPLHKTTLSPRTFRIWELWSPYRFSVSRVHSILSVYVIAIWIFLVARTISAVFSWEEPFGGFNIALLLTLTGCFTFVMVRLSMPDRHKHGEEMVREQPPLKPRHEATPGVAPAPKRDAGPEHIQP